MRLLLVAPTPPTVASHHGGAVYLGALARALGGLEGVELGLVCFRTPDEPPPEVGPFAWTRTVPRRENLHLGTAGLAARRLRLAFDWGIRGMPLLPAKLRSRRFATALREAVAGFRPDAALVEFATMAQYLPALAGVPTVFTDHEAAEPAGYSFAPDTWAGRRNARAWLRYARRHYPRAARLQALTREDADTLEQHLGRSVDVRPAAVPLPPTTVAPDRAGPVALFLGDYRHHPNPEAAHWLAGQAWPRVREEVPDAELWLAGRHGERALTDLEGTPGIRILGFVDDLPALLARTRLLLAPVFSGRGSRIKVLTALAHGLPVVTNELGRRGVCARPPALTTVDPEAGEVFAATVPLLRDAARAREAGRAARAWAEERLAPERIAAEQVARVRELLG